MDRQSAVVVIDKAKLPELIHEMTDSRPGCADHLCQRILIHSWNYAFGSAFLAKMSKQQENTSQPLLARVKKLVDEIRFVSDVAGKQMLDKQFRNVVLFVEHSRHQRLLNLVESAICHGDSRCHTRLLTCEASLTEELTGAQNGDNRFLALLGYNRELHLASTEIEQGIRRLSLPEDVAVRSVFHNGLPAEDAGEDGFPIDRLAFPIRHNNLRLLAEDEP